MNLCKSPLTCVVCNKLFYRAVKDIRYKESLGYKISYCSRACLDARGQKRDKVLCKNCNVQFLKVPAQVRKHPNNFCSKSCANSYNNKHKKHGTRRSKLEFWLEWHLKQKYPNLVVLFNSKEAIDSELDVYIPALKIAFELNGITHYKPIFGEYKFNQIQINDLAKAKACQIHGIMLYSIDVSTLAYIIPKNAQKYIDIVDSIVQSHLLIV